jgi:hypothetical protein
LGLTTEQIIALIQASPCPPYKFVLGCVLCTRCIVPIKPYEVDDVEVRLYNRTDDAHEHWGHVLYLQAKLYRVDIIDGEEGWGYGGKYLLSEHMTRGEVVKKCFVAARDFAEHEVREAFEYRGRRILGPHVDIEALWDVANKFETRSNAPA